MKKLFLKLSVITTPFFLSAGEARAQAIFTTGGLAKSTDPTSVAITIITYLLGIAFTFATIALIVGGFVYLNSAGNEDRAERGKSIITNAIVGLIVIILAFIIAQTINTVVTGCNNGVPTSPDAYGPC